MKFTKMQGLGNDYIYIDLFTEKVTEPEELSRRMSDRHFGIGGDGIVLMMPSNCASARMRIFNADGSEAEMCGNAIRCVGKYLYQHQRVHSQELTIETKSGIKRLFLETSGDQVVSVRVDMGEPILERESIPVIGDLRHIMNEPITVNGETYRYTAVSMGNPHCVIFVPEITESMVTIDGPALEAHPNFPRKINVEFIKVLDKNHLEMRVWERGSGETMACGTGASASLVAAVLNGLVQRKVRVQLRGGELEIEWDESSNHVFMTGPAVEVFGGEWPE